MDRERRPDQARSTQDNDVAQDASPDRMRQAAMVKRKATAPTSGGSALDGGLRAKMEKSLGSDLSGVRLHTDAEAGERSKELGARAYTEGADVHFASGEFNPGTKEGDRLIAHELTHVVQGGAGSGGAAASQAKSAGGGGGGAAAHRKEVEGGEEESAEVEVSDPEEPAEKEADAVADQAVDEQHEGKEAEGDEMGGAEKKDEPPKIQAKLDGAARKAYRSAETRSPMHDKDKDRSLVKVDANKHAIAFEEKLGVAAMGHGTAQSATKKITDQILKFLTVEASKIDETKKTLETDQAKLGDLMSNHVGTPDSAVGVAGSVGKNAAVLAEVFASGNLREQMTIVFNFLRHFNDVMTGATDERRQQFYEHAKVNKEQIEGRITELAGKDGENQNEDGSLKKEGRPSLYKPAERLEDQEEARVETANPDKGTLNSSWRSDRSANDLKGGAAELSPRELAQQQKITGKSGDELMQQKLTWEEGANRWAADSDHAFVASLQQMQLPFAGGPSGTTDRLFTTAEMVGAGLDPNDMRLACIGYLLPIHAHSLSEVMFSSAAHGADEPKPGLEMYSDIKPLTESFLRNTVGGGQLPHEHGEDGAVHGGGASSVSAAAAAEDE